ncbi:MAG TPA: tyrosine/phenylalanine carboxypeptidase domain-containing protein, partial [Polyangiaceae bacterium]|nr:tyrosine/phenylalanine carboxypeptidase domain-containing protein [Polyangiaceae bacterium]
MPDSPRAVRPWLSYKERVSRLAQRLVDAQRPIRVLNAIKWDSSVFEACRDSNWRRLPVVSADDYARISLGFDPDTKNAEFASIIADVANDLGSDGVGDILRHTAEQYLDVVGMLQARGTPRFYELSRKLYGSPKDTFFSGDTRVRDVSQQMYDILTGLDDKVLGAESPRDITAERAVEVLNSRLSEYFGERTVRVMLDDGIVADAAAGSDYIKVRRGALFSERDLKLLEVH